MFDTHAHIHDAAFDADRDAVMERARAADVTEIINVGCDVSDSGRALEVAQRFNTYASVGIHPHEAKDAPADIASVLAPMLARPEVAAIGETGLDYHYAHSPHEAQQRVLRAQLRLARERALPVIFHHREAFTDFLAILNEEWTADMRGVVHCFTGDAAQAQTYTRDFGLRLGIGGVLTFASAHTVRQAVASVRLDDLVLETDCPYLAPVPHRGSRNEPANVAVTAAALARLLDVAVEHVVTATTRTARELFRR